MTGKTSTCFQAVSFNPWLVNLRSRTTAVQKPAAFPINQTPLRFHLFQAISVHPRLVKPLRLKGHCGSKAGCFPNQADTLRPHLCSSYLFQPAAGKPPRLQDPRGVKNRVQSQSIRAKARNSMTPFLSRSARWSEHSPLNKKELSDSSIPPRLAGEKRSPYRWDSAPHKLFTLEIFVEVFHREREKLLPSPVSFPITANIHLFKARGQSFSSSGSSLVPRKLSNWSFPISLVPPW